MGEKRKRMDLSEIRLALEAERENIAVKRASRAEQIARRAMHEIADGKYFIIDDEILVQFTIWQRDIRDYDSDMLRFVLRDNGLMPSNHLVYASDSIDWSGAWLGWATHFKMRLQLYVEPEPDPIEELLQTANEYLNEHKHE